MTKNVYHFDPITSEYLGSGEAEADPLNAGQFLLPAHASFEAPPPVTSGQAAVRSDTGWAVKSDRRGEQYWLADGSRHTIEKIGEDTPAGALTAAPTFPPTDVEIDAETVRRIALAWQADDQIDALAKQINAQTRLDDMDGKTLTAVQKTERDTLKSKRTKTRQIREKGKALKALGPDKRKGLDLTDDTHWAAATTSNTSG